MNLKNWRLKKMNEEWRDVPGLEGYYKVSNCGRVKTVRNGIKKEKKNSIDKCGTLYVNLYKRGECTCFPIHRLVAYAFLDGYTKTSRIIHIDGNKENNNVSNLKVCTVEETNHMLNTQVVISEEQLKLEEWRDVGGYEGRYKVSDMGRLKSYLKDENGYILKHGFNKWGYCIHQIKDHAGHFKGCMIHRLVANAFILNPLNYPEINHKNGIKTDNRVENLEWCTPSQNKIHSYRVLHPDIQKGDKNPNSKLKSDEVLKIYEMALSGKYENVYIANMFKISITTVRDIRMGYRWSHLTHQEQIPRTYLNEKQATAIYIESKTTSKSYSEIAKKYNVSKGRVGSIARGVSYTQYTKNVEIDMNKSKHYETIPICSF
jgi:NUMOD4 motif/HNH endonuclease